MARHRCPNLSAASPSFVHTDILLVNGLLFVLGLILLVKGSAWFIDSAAYLAHRYRISEAVIGLTLVSIGTSLPELATNIYAVTGADAGGVALGNVLGSNITNVLLILGVAVVCMRAIPIDRLLFHRDTLTMMAIFGLFALLCYGFGDDTITRLEGLVLCVTCVIYLRHLLKAPKALAEAIEAEPATPPAFVNSLGRAALVLLIGGAMTILGAKLMVDNVVWAAVRLNAPDELISATIIAFGTSVPELAVTISGVLKKKNDIALGNIVGSNIFNLVLIMGVTATIEPVAVSLDARFFLLPCMLATGLLLTVFMRTRWSLARWEGVILLGGYLAFIGYNVYRCSL